jgi:fermentation-respiration switch protein FrsA (DUF1100 family)
MSIASTLGSLLVGWSLLNGVMFLLQPGMVFYPLAHLETNPGDWGMDFEDVALTTEDGVSLHGWFIPRPGAKRVLLFFHGNAGNISHRADSIRIFHRLGLDVLILDYRGFGKSQGSPSEQGLYRDARAAWDWLTKERGYAPGDLVIFGRSLGAAVATQLASETDPGGLILESGFSSARDASRAIFPLLSWLVLNRYQFDSARALRTVDSPVLVLHSPDDEIIPYALGRKLFEAAREPKQFVTLRGGHNDGFLASRPDYERALEAFLRSLPDTEGERR